MSEELKPCPFCGGEADFHEAPSGLKHYAIWCKNPDCFAGAVEVKGFNAERLVAAWNTRSERTCKPVDRYMVGVLDCDRCYGELAQQDEPIPNYCPHCGAKVVE